MNFEFQKDRDRDPGNRRKSCLIITGGIFDLPEQRAADADFIIACDRGTRYASELGIRPDLLIGDFDSETAPESLELTERHPEERIPWEKGISPEGTEVIRYPSDKDDTDTMLAVREALRRGYREICVLFALGGRLDHLYANIECGTLAAESGAVLSIQSSREELWFLPPGTALLQKREGWSLSLFSLSGRVSGLTVGGTKFEGEEMVLKRGSTLGTSNAFREQEARIAFTEGLLLVILSKLQPGEHN